MLLEINNTENVPEYSEKQKKQYNDAIKAYDHTGNGVSLSLIHILPEILSIFLQKNLLKYIKIK